MHPGSYLSKTEFVVFVLVVGLPLLAFVLMLVAQGGKW